VKRLIVLRPIKNKRKTKGEVRLDNKIHIFGARRTNVTGLNAREPCVEELALPKSVESGNLSSDKAVILWMFG
jgi:hypothetical protein